MASLLMSLKQPICISMCVYLWLAVLAVVNTEEISKARDETGSANEETSGLHILTSRRVKKSPEILQVAALGRPLYPGMLYDARSDSFIPGVTLWDNKLLTEDLNSHPQTRTDLKFSSSDSFSSKSNLLDISSSLKASFLGGLVEVAGSARYLRNTKSSTRQSRVTMHYSATTRFDQLTMSHLGTITYPQVFEQKTATHVVTGVLYGAQAFMVFDRMLSEQENSEHIESEMNLMVRKMSAMNVETHAAFKMTDSEKKSAEKISCTYHGDINPGQSPTTFEEAIKLYKDLPNLLNQQNAVPVKVWLYPLHLLNSAAARVEREISTVAAFTLEGIMEDLAEAERTFNELSGNRLANKFRDIRERLTSFYQSMRVYKSMLQSAVGRVLPAIRGGQKEEKSLEDILKIHRNSPFRSDQLKLWLNDAKQEISVLTAQVNSLEGVNIEEPENVYSSSSSTQVICLTFTSLKYDDPYLSALQEFVKTDGFDAPEEEQHLVSAASVGKWFHNSDTIADMMYNIKVLKYLRHMYFVERNNRLVISAISDPLIPGSSLYVFEQGRLKDKKLQDGLRFILH
uniref:LOC100007703 protein n=1 Tax=Danio rerio TaxID=7955 RepID=A8KBI4_DANRE|nr:LOC100007703 protein [Danio rerio]|eukprot:NP_001104722.1 uncharacterized protein LOC100007703 precursor [Danio rerio]